MIRRHEDVIARIKALTICGALKTGTRDELGEAIEQLDHAWVTDNSDELRAAVARIAKVFLRIDMH